MSQGRVVTDEVRGAGSTQMPGTLSKIMTILLKSCLPLRLQIRFSKNGCTTISSPTHPPRTLSVLIKKWRLLPFLLNLGRVSNFLDKENVAEVTLCDTQDQVIKHNMVYVWFSLCNSVLTLESSHHTVRKPKLIQAETTGKGPRGELEAFS